VGVVTALIPQARLEQGRAVAFVCGPEVMVRYAVAGLREGGVAGDDVYVSMERNMKCAVGFCGHCQFGPTFICKDGPVFRHSRVEAFLRTHEV
jgi:NAD(P)H-flavin reductase